MPVGVVTNAREEHKWERAKQIAAEEGHEKDWQYIMGIYKRMNPNRFKAAAALLKSALYKEAYSSTSIPSYGSPSSGEFKYRGGINPGVGTAVGPRPPVRHTFRPRPTPGVSSVNPSVKVPNVSPIPVSTRPVPYGYSRNSAGDLTHRPATGLATAYDDPIGAANIAYSRASKSYGATTPVPRSAVRRQVAKPVNKQPQDTFMSMPYVDTSNYVPPPRVITGPDGSTTRSVYIPPVEKYKGSSRAARSAAQIRNDTANLSAPFRNSNFVWDPKAKAYNFTGSGNGSMDAAQELARLRHIYNGMNRAERAKYKDQWKARMRALEPYKPIEHFSY